MSQLVQTMFGVNLRVMQSLGFYPPRRNFCLYKSYSFIVYCTCTSLFPVLASLYLILDPEVNLNKIADSAFIICQLGSFIFKMIPFLLNESNIRKSIYMIEHPVFLTYTQDQKKIIDDCRKTCKRTSWLFLNFCFACVITWSVAPFFEEEYVLPMNIWLPYDFSANITLYCVSFAYVIIAAGSGAISNGAIDPLIAGLAYYATCQIKILKDNLEHLSEYTDDERAINQKTTPNREKSESFRKRIKHCIYHHNIIIQFVENFQKTYSSMVFTQFSASVLVICICCFKLSQVQVFSVVFIWMSVFLVTMLSEIFLYCYFGTTLYEENNTLIQSVYMGKWYDYDIKSQKLLLTLMERSRRPMIVTAGKILDLSLETFTMILRRAYSLFAVLKNY